MSKKKQTFDKDTQQEEILELYRKILGGVELRDINFADSLTGEDRVQFLRYCSMVASNEWFEKIMSALYWPHIVHAGTQSPNYDIVSFNRATGNGIKMAEQFFQKYSNRYAIELEGKEETFDEHSPFEPLGGSSSI